MFAFEFGKGDDGRDIGSEIRKRMGPSLAIALPVFVIGLLVNITFALLMVFFRATYLDLVGRGAVRGADVDFRACSTSSPGSISSPSCGSWCRSPGSPAASTAWKFILLPVLVSVVAGIGGGARWYRTIFIEEIGKDYVRTARAKGLSRSARAVPPCAEERHDPHPHRRGGGDSHAVHGQPASPNPSSAFPASAATPSTPSRRRISPWCGRWCSSARCSTSSA